MNKFNLKVLLLLSCGHMVVDTYQGALPAILPFLKENLGLSYTVTGAILIVANIASSIVQPLFGFLSDRKEKAFLLPLGVFLAGAGFEGALRRGDCWRRRVAAGSPLIEPGARALDAAAAGRAPGARIARSCPLVSWRDHP